MDCSEVKALILRQETYGDRKGADRVPMVEEAEELAR